jgi:ribose transport system ATP-binding protein
MSHPTAIPTEPAPRLRMKGVRKRFGPTIALDGVDLHVASGEVLALVGENGAGKSTLMKILSGAHAPDEGQMWLDEHPYSPRDPLEARRSGVAMIYQELSLAKDLTVMENILLGMEPTAGPLLRRSEMKRRAANAMAQLGRPDIDPALPLSKLSLAERQLVEIGRAICIGCRVLVLDEPTSSLAQSDIRHLFDLVRRLKSAGLAIIYISHFLEEVREISDRFEVLRDGKSVGGGQTAHTPASRIISMMVGRSVDDLYPRSARKQGEPILQITHLAGDPRPLDATLTLHRGEIVGIAGLVGAGRTELLRSIFGLDRITSGQVRIGAYVGPASPARRWAEGIGLLSEDRKNEGLAVDLSIADNITLTRLGPLVNPTTQADESRTWIQKLNIRCRSPRQTVRDLSGGNQQKVAVARLLRHDVDVFLLDEPTRGIDLGSKAQIYQLIDELACRGKAILMISSYLPELLGVCDRIAVMCKGRLGNATPVAQTNEHQIMLEATGALEMA